MSDASHVKTRLPQIAGQIHRCEHVSALIIFVAGMAGPENNANALVLEAADCVQLQPQKASRSSAAAEELHEATRVMESAAP